MNETILADEILILVVLAGLSFILGIGAWISNKIEDYLARKERKHFKPVERRKVERRQATIRRIYPK